MSSFEPWNIKIFKETSKVTKLKKVDYGDLEKTCKEKGFHFDIYTGDRLEKLTFFYDNYPEMGLTIHGGGGITDVTKYEFPMLVWDNIISKKYTMIEADLVPLRPDDKDYIKKYIEPMVPIHNKYKDLPGYDANPSEWWKELSSPYNYLARLPTTSDYMQIGTGVLMEYFHLWLKFYKEAKPVKDPKILKKVAERKKFVKDLMIEHDPGRGVLRRRFGDEIARKLTGMVTF